MTPKVKLIVTADDYGVIPEIDDAIIDGIKSGIINTVSVVVNFKDSESALKKLVKELIVCNKLKKVGIGLHLNITMGKPISKLHLVKSLVGRAKNFYTQRTYQKDPDLKRFDLDQIRTEAFAQMQTFLSYLEKISKEESIQLVPIDHISSHFNLFNAIPDLAKFLVEISKKYKKFGLKKTLPIPVRRPMPLIVEYKKFNDKLKSDLREISRETTGYIITKNLSLGALFYKSKWLKKPKLRKLISEAFLANEIRTAHGMFICFYATEKDFDLKIKDFTKLIPAIHKAAIKEGVVKKEETFFLEVVHHLGNPLTKARRKKLKISGFDRGYMRKFRHKEVAIIKENRYSDIFKLTSISHGRYSDIPKLK